MLSRCQLAIEYCNATDGQTDSETVQCNYTKDDYRQQPVFRNVRHFLANVHVLQKL